MQQKATPYCLFLPQFHGIISLRSAENLLNLEPESLDLHAIAHELYELRRLVSFLLHDMLAVVCAARREAALADDLLPLVVHEEAEE